MVDFTFDVVPIESQSEIASSFPVGVELVILAKACEKMFHVLVVDVLYSKVIDNKSEADGTPIMMPVTRCNPALAISCEEEALDEKVLGDDACLGEAIHTMFDFTIREKLENACM